MIHLISDYHQSFNIILLFSWLKMIKNSALSLTNINDLILKIASMWHLGTEITSPSHELAPILLAMITFSEWHLKKMHSEYYKKKKKSQTRWRFNGCRHLHSCYLSGKGLCSVETEDDDLVSLVGLFIYCYF